MIGSPRAVAARLQARGRKAQKRLEAQTRETVVPASKAAAQETPVRTGLARRSWRVARITRGVRLSNVRPYARRVHDGDLIRIGRDAVLRQLRRDRPTIARALKEA